LAPDHMDEEFFYSHAASSVANASFGIGSNLTWDSFVRKSYNAVNTALTEQSEALVRRGNVLYEEAKYLVEGQRNRMVLEMRKRLSPFGRLYSEILKPADKLPTLDQLLRKKGSLTAVLSSVGKTRGSVNRFAAVVRMGGPTTIVVQFGFSAVIIASAEAEDRARVSATQAGTLGGAALGGWGGAWAGCAALSSILSPSLVIPWVGQITTGGACLVGGIAGGFGGAWIGGMVGESAGEAAYDFVTEFEWVDA